MMSKFYSIFVFCLISGISLSGQNRIFISFDGSDIEGNGSISKPFKTLEHAAQFVEASDTILLRGGEYFNKSYGDNDIWEGDNFARLILNGSPGNYITIKSYPEERAVIHFDHTYGILLINSSYVIIEDLTIVGVNEQITLTEAQEAWGLYKTPDGIVHDLAKEMDVNLNDPELIGQVISKDIHSNIKKPAYYNGRGLVMNKSHHVILRNNEIRNTPASALRVQQSDHASVYNNEISYCTFWTSLGVGALTVAESMNVDEYNEVKIEISRNNVHHNENKLVSWNPGKDFVNFVIDEGSGIFLTRNSDSYEHGKYLIVNNLSYQNGARGIVVHKTDNAVIEHNTLYYNGNNCTGAGAGIGVNSVQNVVIRNNIIYSRPEKWALGILAQPVVDLTVSHNLLFNENGQEALTRNIIMGWEEADPLCENVEAAIFDLTENSPAIDAAQISENQTIDYYGNERTDGIADIGAIEYLHSNQSENKSQMENFQLYPNPCQDHLYLQSPSKIDRVEILNCVGHQMQSFEVKDMGNELLKIDLSEMKCGIYFIRFGSQIKKIIHY